MPANLTTAMLIQLPVRGDAPFFLAHDRPSASPRPPSAEMAGLQNTRNGRSQLRIEHTRQRPALHRLEADQITLLYRQFLRRHQVTAVIPVIANSHIVPLVDWRPRFGGLPIGTCNHKHPPLTPETQRNTLAEYRMAPPAARCGWPQTSTAAHVAKATCKGKLQWQTAASTQSSHGTPTGRHPKGHYQANTASVPWHTACI